MLDVYVNESRGHPSETPMDMKLLRLQSLALTALVCLVGYRALRNLPRIKAVWSFLEELTSEFP